MFINNKENILNKAQEGYIIYKPLQWLVPIIGITSGLVVYAIGLFSQQKIGALKNMKFSDAMIMMGSGLGIVIFTAIIDVRMNQFKIRREKSRAHWQEDQQVDHQLLCIDQIPKPSKPTTAIVQVYPRLFFVNTRTADSIFSQDLSTIVKNRGINSAISFVLQSECKTNYQKTLKRDNRFSTIVLDDQMEAAGRDPLMGKDHCFLSSLPEIFKKIDEKRGRGKVVIDCSSTDSMTPVIILAYIMSKHSEYSIDDLACMIPIKFNYESYKEILTSEDFANLFS